MSYSHLRDRVAFITGAASGIGRATASLLAQCGMRLALLDANRDALFEFGEQLRHDGYGVIWTVARTTDVAETRSLMEIAANSYGRFDVVFANAGANGVWAPLNELTLDDWRDSIEANLTGTFVTVQEALPHLRRDGGSVIITSSVNGTRMFSNSGATAYACAKAGQVALAKMLALELAKDRIRVNVVIPGAVDTNISENTEQRHVERAREPADYPEGTVPLTDGEPADPFEVARLVRFLASDESRHITGAEIVIDGAGSLLQG